ncbi:beta family protein [Agrobacterium pusense]|uniref:beta family protein n=1 Tax=Agrobacterium pusense TaxID=648995 RepID=UPI003FD01B76
MTVNYIPVMSVRPSEIIALTEVPDVAKDRMLPLFLVRPWLGQGPLLRATDRVRHAIGERKWIASLDVSYKGEDAESLADMARLQVAENGFANWKNFVGNLPNCIPSAIVCGDIGDFRTQIIGLRELGRGLAVRFDRRTTSDISPYVFELSKIDFPELYVVIDYGQRNARLLSDVETAISDCKIVMDGLPDVNLAISATTFPSSFEAESETIYERVFHSSVAQGIPSNTLIYSDHGSTRVSEQQGGGVPRPRIDLPRDNNWHFFRSNLVRKEDMSRDEYISLRDEEYKAMADLAIKSRHWDPNLNIWGTQFIKITQLGSGYGINSPAKSTACRINIHLTRQALYGASLSSRDFEEDWED